MRMLVCNFTDLVLVCVPLLELSCCCSFAKAETKTRIKVVFITLTTKVIKTQLKLCYQYIHCKRKKYGLSDLLFPNSKWFWPCPHVSGYFWIRILFFSDVPFIHTHPVNPTCESGNVWICSPEWKLLNPIFFRIRVDGRIWKLSNLMTLHDWVQSLQSS